MSKDFTVESFPLPANNVPPKTVAAPVKALEVPAKTRDPAWTFNAPAPVRTFESVSVPARLNTKVALDVNSRGIVSPAKLPVTTTVPVPAIARSAVASFEEAC